MFRSSSKIEIWGPDRILVILFVVFVVGANGCKQNSDFADNSDELHAKAGPTTEDQSRHQRVPSEVKATTTEQTNEITKPALTAETDSKEPETKPLRLFLDDQYASANAGVQAELTDDQLHKNFTLLLLTLEPDIRARGLVKYLRNVLTEEQKKQALEIALADDHKFLKLRQRRAEILENAFDGQNIEQELRKILVETVETSRMIRAEVYNNVLTQEQRDALAAQKKLDAEEKKATSKEEGVEIAETVPEKQDPGQQ